VLQDLYSIEVRARAKVWAALTLAVAVTTGSAIAIANAQGNGHDGARPDKVVKCSLNSACVHGNNGSSGPGVEGDSTFGYGVLGQSSGQNAGVGGFSSASAAGASGVYGQSENGFGVYGFSVSSSGYGLFSQGNVFVQGEIFTSGSCHSGCSRTRKQASFGARTSQPTIDDVGESALREGIARVALAPDFANAIDASKPYVVLLTPEGDASLYVANRTASGFEVRQIGGGRSSVAFAYRIVAKPYGVSDERMPFKTVTDASAFSLRHLAH
jgi:hypothetical protein